MIPIAAVVADPPAVPPSPDEKPVLDGQHWPFPEDRFQLAPFLAYTLFGGVDVMGGTLRIEDALIYGIVFDARVRGMARVEIEYRRMVSDLAFEQPFAPTTKLFGLGRRASFLTGAGGRRQDPVLQARWAACPGSSDHHVLQR